MLGQNFPNEGMTEIDLYIFQLPQPQQEIVQHLRAFITRRYPEFTEALKWHVPVYSLNKTKPLLGLQVFNRHVNLNFFKGDQLDDPDALLVGSGKYVRHISFQPLQDIDYATLQNLIDQTIINERVFQQYNFPRARTRGIRR